MDTQLTNKGWSISDDGLQFCRELCTKENPLASDIIKVALANDLRKIGRKKLPESFSSGQLDNIVGPVVLQIQKLRNLSAPIANQESQGAPRMLKFNLTDGFTSCVGIEFKPVACLNAKMIPGMKICLNGKVPLVKGVMLFEDGNVSNLGGEVEILKSKWEANKHAESAKRTVVSTGDQPPPFKEFNASKPIPKKTPQPTFQQKDDKSDSKGGKNQRNIKQEEKQTTSYDPRDRNKQGFKGDIDARSIRNDQNALKTKNSSFSNDYDKKKEGYVKDTRDSRSFQKESRDKKPFQKDSRDSKPFQKDSRDNKAFQDHSRDNKSFQKDNQEKKSFQKEILESKSFSKDNQNDKSFKKDVTDNKFHKAQSSNYSKGNESYKETFQSNQSSHKNEPPRDASFYNDKRADKIEKHNKDEESSLKLDSRRKVVATRDRSEKDFGDRDKKQNYDLAKRNDRRDVDLGGKANHNIRDRSQKARYDSYNEKGGSSKRNDRQELGRKADARDKDHDKDLNREQKTGYVNYNEKSDYTRRNQGSENLSKKYPHNYDDRKSTYKVDEHNARGGTRSQDVREDKNYGNEHSQMKNDYKREDKKIDRDYNSKQDKNEFGRKTTEHSQTKNDYKREDRKFNKDYNSKQDKNEFSRKTTEYSQMKNDYKREDRKFDRDYNSKQDKNEFSRKTTEQVASGKYSTESRRDFKEGKKDYSHRDNKNQKFDLDYDKRNTSTSSDKNYRDHKRFSGKNDTAYEKTISHNSKGSAVKSYTENRNSKEPDTGSKMLAVNDSETQKCLNIKKEMPENSNENPKQVLSSQNSGQRIPLDVLFGKALHVTESDAKQSEMQIDPETQQSHLHPMQQDTLNLMSNPHQYLSQMSPQEIQYLQWSISQQSYILNQFQQQQQQQSLHNTNTSNIPLAPGATPFISYNETQHYANYPHQHYSNNDYSASETQLSSTSQITSQSNHQQQQRQQQQQQQTYNQMYYPYEPRTFAGNNQ